MRKKKTRALDIAKQRIEYLYDLATSTSDVSISRTAIRHLRAVATKHNICTPKLNKTFCKSCNSILIPGRSCSIRIHTSRRVITCSNCSTIKRLGLSAQ